LKLKYYIHVIWSKRYMNGYVNLDRLCIGGYVFEIKYYSDKYFKVSLKSSFSSRFASRQWIRLIADQWVVAAARSTNLKGQTMPVKSDFLRQLTPALFSISTLTHPRHQRHRRHRCCLRLRISFLISHTCWSSLRKRPCLAWRAHSLNLVLDNDETQSEYELR